ncbi:MAG: ABC transporter substrate-binding protein, partial [Thermomicrobiales bacterium]
LRPLWLPTQAQVICSLLYFSDEVNAQIATIPELAAEKGPTGGAVISLETVLALQPDLIIGYETETLTRDSLARFGVGLYALPSYCDASPAVSFESVYAEVRRYGQMFDRADAAETAATRLEQQVAAAVGARWRTASARPPCISPPMAAPSTHTRGLAWSMCR